MPDQPRTQHRSVRIDDADWADLDAVAKKMGTDRAKVINAYIRWHLRRPKAKQPERPEREMLDLPPLTREESNRELFFGSSD